MPDNKSVPYKIVSVTMHHQTLDMLTELQHKAKLSRSAYLRRIIEERFFSDILVEEFSMEASS